MRIVGVERWLSSQEHRLVLQRTQIPCLEAHNSGGSTTKDPRLSFASPGASVLTCTERPLRHIIKNKTVVSARDKSLWSTLTVAQVEREALGSSLPWLIAAACLSQNCKGWSYRMSAK